MMKHVKTGRARGFTLVEAVVVIVITGIVSGMTAMFIRLPVRSYVEGKARAELTDTADLALRRMGREIRLALPNSIVILNNGTGIRFLMTKTGGTYQSVDDISPVGAPLDFVNSGPSFVSLGAPSSGRQQIVAGDFIVVYNLGPGTPRANAYELRNAARVAAAVPGAGLDRTTITLANNAFAPVFPETDPAFDSPSHRFQVVAGTVTYLCNGGVQGSGTLTRNFTTGISSVMPAANTSPLLASHVTSCNFNYTSLANQNSALLDLTLSLQRDGSEGPVTLSYQLHSDNTP